MTPWCEKGVRGQGDVIRCKGHVIGLFRPAWPWQRVGSRRVTGRGVTQPAGDVPRVLSLQVFNVSAINENRRENTILFQTLVRGAVMMIRPPTSSIGERASEGRSISASIVSRSQTSTSGVGHRNNRGGLGRSTPPITGFRSHRWHAAWRASMTRLSMNQFNQTSGCRRHAACGACENISRDEVYVGTTLVSQALSAGRVSPM